ncbi:sulfotransferase [Verrucomicrobiota bacterium]
MECDHKELSKKSGGDLIFLISLPRSGSTLLQHILGSHSLIATSAEPWILLPACYALRKNGLKGEYNAEIGRIGLTEFLGVLEDNEDSYYVAVRKMAMHLYETFLSKKHKKIFLDKTSRYYLILPELMRVFPDARYVFLVRNPLDVFASFLENMVNRDWRGLGEPGIRNDLLSGYKYIEKGISSLSGKAVVVKYEDIVSDPASAISGLCENLNISYEAEMLNYGDRIGVLEGKLVDPKSIHKHNKCVADYSGKWKSKINTRQEKYLAYSFLKHLDQDMENRFGYSFKDMLSDVSDLPVKWSPVVAWDKVMRLSQKPDRWHQLWINIGYEWEQKGVLKAFLYMFKLIIKRILCI